jgi:hypothetical protein
MTAIRLLPCAAVFVAWLAGGGHGSAQTTAPGSPAPARVGVSVAAGLFLPAEDSVSRVYEGTRVPWSVDGDIHLAGRLSAFAGARFLAVDGRANGLDPAGGVSTDTALSTRSLLAGVRVHHRWGRLGVFAGGGAAWSWYTETWPGLDARFSGRAWGPLVQGGVVYHAWRHMGVIGRVDWFRASTGQGSLLDSDVDLGGVDAAGGVTFRF